MLRTLYSKLAAVLLGLFALVGGVSIYGTVRFVDLYYQEAQQRLNFSLAQHLVEQGGIHSVVQADPARMRALFDMQMIANPNITLYLLDSRGGVLFHSASRNVVKPTYVSLAPIRRYLGQHHELPILGDDPLTPDMQRIFSVAPILRTEEVEGYLYVLLGGTERSSMGSIWRNSHVMKLAVGMGVLVLCMGLITGLMLFGTMTRRLERLADAMDEFKRSDFSVRPAIGVEQKADGGDEIHRLTANFRDLASRTSAQLKKLTETDVLRRELVANVSHDLRTPLATLQGYVDTLLLKDDRLSQQERLSYLQIASRSCERLSKLVGNLIELAKLDAKEVKLQFETFSPAELIQDIVQKFQLKAEERRISLQTDLPEGAPYVHADIGLIERVLENLIGNALAHTDPGGIVRVGLAIQGEHVMVRVTDTGIGISEDEIPHLFERFYRVANGERGSGEHAGLGLAIAKSILDLHGSRMEVESKVGLGTTFSFALDKAGIGSA